MLDFLDNCWHLDIIGGPRVYLLEGTHPPSLHYFPPHDRPLVACNTNYTIGNGVTGQSRAQHILVYYGSASVPTPEDHLAYLYPRRPDQH